MINIYTDGAASGNPGPGGFGAILQYGPHEKVISTGYKLTTNNRMELLAVIVALEALKKAGCDVVVYSDSSYVVNAVSKHWLENWVAKDFKGKKNKDLWERYLRAAFPHRVRFVWIKGHAGHPQNERCDRLAVAAASDTANLLEDTGYLLQADPVNEDQPATLL